MKFDDDGFLANVWNFGAVVAAAPKDQVKHLEPLKGHIVLLIGGRTGRRWYWWSDRFIKIT